MSLIDPTSVPQLAARYPRDASRLRHQLAAEPLLGYAALAQAARDLPRQHVERRVHDAGNGEAFRLLDDDTHPADSIAAGGVSSQGIMLRYIEQLPAYDPQLRADAPWLRAAASRVGQRMGLL